MKLFNHVGLDPIEMSAKMVEGKRVYLTTTTTTSPTSTTTTTTTVSATPWRQAVLPRQCLRNSACETALASAALASAALQGGQG